MAAPLRCVKCGKVIPPEKLDADCVCEECRQQPS